MSDDARGDCESQPLRLAVELTQEHTGLHTSRSSLTVDLDPLHQGQIDHHATITDGQTRKAVPPASYRDEEAVHPRETHRGSDVGHPGAAHDQRRVSVDRSVPHLSVLLVAVVISTDELTVQRRSEVVDGALVQANVLGRGQNGHARSVDPRDGRCQEPEFHPSPG